MDGWMDGRNDEYDYTPLLNKIKFQSYRDDGRVINVRFCAIKTFIEIRLLHDSKPRPRDPKLEPLATRLSGRFPK